MFQVERIEAILDILKHNGYVTVKYLTEELGYSNATVNRDLNVMEQQKLIKRSYGGVELVEKQEVSLPFRYHKMKSIKSRIGQKGAEFVQDGDVIFVDASTTTEHLGRNLIHKKDITVITNNIALVMFLSEHNVKVICLGGSVVEAPYMLMGMETVKNAMQYRVDKTFFSTGAISSDGQIGGCDTYYMLHQVMIENAKQCFFLADHDKIDKQYHLVHNLEQGSCIIMDYEFSEQVKKKYSHLKFVEV